MYVNDMKILVYFLKKNLTNNFFSLSLCTVSWLKDLLDTGTKQLIFLYCILVP